MDVWAQRAGSKPSGYVFTSESLCQVEELAGSEFYNDFLRRGGILHGMFGVVENDPGRRLGSLSLYRGAAAGEFQPAELQVLESLMPHIRRAFRLHIKFSELDARTKATETILNQLSTAVVFVGASGEVLLMNRQAEELLRARDGLITLQGKLCATAREESARLQAAVAAAVRTGNAAGSSASGTLLISRAKGRPLAVTVSPIRDHRLSVGKPPRAVLFITDPDQNTPVPADLLRQGFGLTAAEARLATVLVEDRSLKEAADLCGVTQNTAKSQLKSVFSKTGIRRQAELVRLLLNCGRRA